MGAWQRSRPLSQDWALTAEAADLAVSSTCSWVSEAGTQE